MFQTQRFVCMYVCVCVCVCVRARARECVPVYQVLEFYIHKQLYSGPSNRRMS